MMKKILSEVVIECDPPRLGYWTDTAEDRARQLEDWCKDFNKFLRDHRSQDQVALSVRRVYEETCEFCHNAWEVDDDGVPQCCEKAEKEFHSLKSAFTETVT